MLNRINRRQFLTLVLAAIQTSTLLVDPKVANAIEEYPEDKIVVSIRMARAALAAKGDKDAEHTGVATATDFMNTAFDAVNVDTAEVRTLLNAEIGTLLHDTESFKRDYLDEEEARRLLEAILPIAIMREMLRKHQLRIDTNNSPAFKSFVRRYGGLIIDSDSPSRIKIAAVAAS